MTEQGELIRTFKTTGVECGVALRQIGTPHEAWFVVDRNVGETDWHTHCGPYSTRDQAVWWIEQIRETRA